MPRSYFVWFFSCVACFVLTPTATAQLIPAGATWKYLDDGSDQGSAWQTPGFNDSSWLAGPAHLGYGDGDEETVLSFGPNASNKYITTYFRHEFSVANPANIVDLTLKLLDDDGSVVYLNGIEVLRNNMPTGNVNYLTPAAGAVGPRENHFDYFSLAPSLLLAGTNILAVELHQSSGTSSDISFDLELLGDLPAAVVRGPYLQMAGPDRMQLRWRTPFAQNSRVQLGAAPGAFTQVVDDLTVTTEHTVLITGLAPETVYFYSVGDTAGVAAGDDREHWFRTSPLAGSQRPGRFWLLGDAGTGTVDQLAVRDAYLAFGGSRVTDLMILLGDNAYGIGTDPQYQNGIFDVYAETLRNTPLLSTRGNHDGTASTYYDIFDFPTAAENGGLASGSEAYYAFDFGNVHFICLDSDSTDRSPTGAMATWLAADLAATAQPWIVAYFHHPPYTKGTHDSDSLADSGGRLVEMRENILPILEDGGVDLVFSGHSHSYERSFLIDGHYGYSASFNASHQLDSGDGSPQGDGAYVKGFGPHQGTVYTVTGTAGKTSSAGTLNHVAMQNSLRDLGSVVFDVDADRLDVTFLTSTGQTLDQYTLTTTDQPPILSTSGMIAGQPVTVTVRQATPGSLIVLAYSLTGAGPTPSLYGDILLDTPIFQLPIFTADPFGRVQAQKVVPPALRGQTIWMQALEVTGTLTGLLSNGLAEVVQ